MGIYSHLKTTKNTGSGVGELVYIAREDWFDSLQKPASQVASQTNSYSHLTIGGDHTFLNQPGQNNKKYGFLVARLLPDKNKVGGKSVGDAGNLRINTEFDFELPGLNEENVGLVSGWLTNVPLVVLVKDANLVANIGANDQMVYQLGGTNNSAYISSVELTTGTTKDGSKGIAGKIAYAGIPLFYNGVITEFTL